ncbi:MAG: hypothetical protein V3S98_09600, partial [Dehalococcoidia bacterium]
YEGYPDEFPVAEYAANIGLAVAAQRSTKLSWRRDTVEQTLVNLLPERYRRTRIPAKVFGAVALLVVLAAGAFGLTTVAASASASVSSLDAQVSRLERVAAVSRIQVAQVNVVRAQIPVVMAQIEAVDAQTEVLAGEVALLLERVRFVTTDSPLRQVRVLSAEISKGGVKILATAPSSALAMAWADALRQSGLLGSVETTSVTTEALGNRVNFLVETIF